MLRKPVCIHSLIRNETSIILSRLVDSGKLLRPAENPEQCTQHFIRIQSHIPITDNSITTESSSFACSFFDDGGSDNTERKFKLWYAGDEEKDKITDARIKLSEPYNQGSYSHSILFMEMPPLHSFLLRLNRIPNTQLFAHMIISKAKEKAFRIKVRRGLVFCSFSLSAEHQVP